MNVKVHLLSQSQPIVREPDNAYVKNEMYCLYFEASNRVEKYPLVNIFRVTEDYK